MWPSGHLASAILFGRWFDLTETSGRRVALLAGAIAPDIIDKPIGSLSRAPAYHTVGHSLLTAGFLSIIAYIYDEEDGLLRALVAGTLIHIGGDLILTVDKYDQPSGFLWPVARPENPVSRPFVEYVLEYATSVWFLLEMTLVALVFATDSGEQSESGD